MNVLADEEMFVPMKGFECCYEISNLGRVRSLPRVGRTVEFLSAKKTGYGYPAIEMRCKGVKKAKSIHRLVVEHFIPNPNPEELTMVNHVNGDMKDFRISNLERVSPGQNRAHSFLMKGRRHPNFRLSTLEYLHMVENFKSVEDLFDYLRNAEIGKLDLMADGKLKLVR